MARSCHPAVSRYDDEIWELVPDPGPRPPAHIERFVAGAGARPGPRSTWAVATAGCRASLRAEELCLADVSEVALGARGAAAAGRAHRAARARRPAAAARQRLRARAVRRDAGARARRPAAALGGAAGARARWAAGGDHPGPWARHRPGHPAARLRAPIRPAVAPPALLQLPLAGGAAGRARLPRAAPSNARRARCWPSRPGRTHGDASPDRHQSRLTRPLGQRACTCASWCAALREREGIEVVEARQRAAAAAGSRRGRPRAAANRRQRRARCAVAARRAAARRARGARRRGPPPAARPQPPGSPRRRWPRCTTWRSSPSPTATGGRGGSTPAAPTGARCAAARPWSAPRRPRRSR